MKCRRAMTFLSLILAGNGVIYLEKVIVTFIHKGLENDIAVPNQIEGQKLAGAIHEWLGNEDEWSHGLHDLEYSFDNKHWFCLQKNKTLQEVGIWDGAYMRLSDGITSELPTESQFEMDNDEENGSEYEQHEAPGYAWKIIE